MTLGVAFALGGPPMGSVVRFALCLALVACGSDHEEELVVTPMYSATTARVVVGLSKQVDGDIYVEARRGNLGSLDCADLAARTAPLARGDELFVDGPLVDPALL